MGLAEASVMRRDTRSRERRVTLQHGCAAQLRLSMRAAQPIRFHHRSSKEQRSTQSQDSIELASARKDRHR
jgi:hypothetical protein